MKEGQPAIYYMTGPSRRGRRAVAAPRGFRAKGYEVLFFTDPLDELWLRLPRELDGKPLVSAAKGDVTPATEEEKKQAEEQRREQEEGFKDLLLVLRAKLQDHVKDVRLSTPAHLVAGLPGGRGGRSLPARGARCSAGRASRCRWPSASSS